MDDRLQRVSLRMPAGLLTRLDSFAVRMRATSPGLIGTRADVIRMLLERSVENALVQDAVRASQPKWSGSGVYRKEPGSDSLDLMGPPAPGGRKAG